MGSASEGETTLIRSNAERGGYGILPPARELAALEAIHPGAARALLERAQREDDHRRSLQAARLRANITSRYLTQGFTALGLLASLFVARDLVFAGYSVFAMILALSSLAALALVFIVVEARRRDDLPREQRALPEGRER